MERNSFMDATSPKDERFETLKQLYPELIRDNKLNLEALKDLFDEESFDEGEVGYNLYWPGKRDAKKLARKEAEGTLEPVIGDGVNEDKTSNIYIEGDNLEVLRCLKKSYGGRVKMIYIDPPYNTGKDFIYPDNFAEPIEDYLKFTGQVDEKGVSLVANPKSSGAYHRKWLDMMLPRLQLARELLTNDGVIFISIDDNEQANLKLLCDEVFGEENYLGMFPRITKKAGKTAEAIAKNHDYILTYSKNEKPSIYLPSHSDDGFKYEDEFVKERGPYKLNQTLDYDSLSYSSSLDYPIEIDGKTLYPGNSYEKYLERKSGKHARADWAWRWSKDLYEFGLRNGFVVLKKYKDYSRLYTKTYQNCRIVKAKNSNDYSIEYFDRTKAISTLKFVENEFSNDNSKKDLIKIFKSSIFDYSKPVDLLKSLSFYSTDKDDIILDFFSGSATTAHAVMQLNAEDSGKRKFIMVQLPVDCEKTPEVSNVGFKTICEIGKERIRCAGKMILEEHPELKDKLDIGFKVYRLAQSNIEAYKPTTGSDQQSLLKALDAMEKQVTPLRDGFDLNNSNDIQKLLTEIMLRQGFALDSRIEKTSSLANNTVYRITDEARPIVLHVCLDNEIKSETVKNISFEENDKFVCLNSAISDELYAQLSDKGRVETI